MIVKDWKSKLPPVSVTRIVWTPASRFIWTDVPGWKLVYEPVLATVADAVV